MGGVVKTCRINLIHIRKLFIPHHSTLYANLLQHYSELETNDRASLPETSHDPERN